MKAVYFTILFVLSGLAAFAQFSDSAHYYAGVASTGTLNKTNSSSSYVLSNVVKLGVKHKDFGMNFTNTWLFGEQQKKLTNNDYNSVFDVNLYKTFPHFYYWGLANYTTSYSLKINNQYQAGLGIAYNIIDKKNAFLNISDGILYESSDINLGDTVRDIYTTSRNSFRISFKFLINELFVISGTSFIQNSLLLRSDYIVKSNLSLGFKVRKWLTVSTAFSYNRFNRTQKENTLFNYGLVFDQYF